MSVRQKVGNLIEGADRRYVDSRLRDGRTGVELKSRTKSKPR